LPATGRDVTGPVKKRWKLIVGTAALALVVIWLALFLAVGGDFYQSVGEVKASSSSTHVRVGGFVASGSVVQEGSVVNFVMKGEESGETLDVVYRGEYPDRLRPGEKVVVTGSLQPDGTLAADVVLIRCPDKLVTEKMANKVLTGSGLERLLY